MVVMMPHEKFRKQIPRYLAGHLSAADAAAFLEHVQGCPDCLGTLAQEKELWDLLAQADADSLGSGSSLWPGIQRRTFRRDEDGSWFFGQGRLSRTGLAAGALAAGLAFGWFMPTWMGNGAGTVGYTETYTTESSWLDDSSTDDLAGLWLDMGATEESDGS